MKDQTQKRGQILSAAMKVFAEKGFYKTTVSDIARTANVAHGTICLYFKTKDEILIQIFEKEISALIDHMQREIGREPRVENKLRRLIEIQMNLIETNPELTELLLLEARQSGKFLRSTAINQIANYCELIEGVLKQGVEEGIIRSDLNLSAASTVIFGGIEGIATRWILETKRGFLSEMAQTITKLILSGIFAPQI